VSNTFGPEKSALIADLAASTRAWQDIINVRFRYDSTHDASCDKNTPNVDFAVMFIPATWTYAGCASSKLLWDEAVEGMCAGAGTLGVKARAQIEDAPAPFENVTVRGLLRHELGHMLGFRHEHVWAEDQGGCSEAIEAEDFDITGRRLTAYDRGSVMHYAQCDGIAGTDHTITRTDGDGARKLYGMPASWYVAPLAVQAWLL
jgi:hypothetical protein